MKTLKILTFIASAMIIIACNSSKSPEVAGTFITDYKNEYTIGNDTLEVTVYNTDGRSYQIERKTSFQKIRNGNMLPREFKKVKWTAAYEQEKQILIEGDLGRKIYIKDGQTLKLGETEYHRIK